MKGEQEGRTGNKPAPTTATVESETLQLKEATEPPRSPISSSVKAKPVEISSTEQTSTPCVNMSEPCNTVIVLGASVSSGT